MNFIDLGAQYRLIENTLNPSLLHVLRHGQYILGPEVSTLERDLARYVGTRHCITCANGTDALVLALRALGIGPGDAVMVPTFTFFASAEAINLVGAQPVFVDIDPHTYTICLKSLKEQYMAHSQLNIRAIIAVDLFGVLADYQALEKFARKHKLFLIEDAAQSFGAHVNNRRAGSFGTIATTSFFPAKPLGCYGDGGALFCNDDALAELLRSLRVHGQGEDKHHNDRIGMNSRLDTLQAAVLLEKLRIFPQELVQRQQVAMRYQAFLQHPELTLPLVPFGHTSAWAQYTIATRMRTSILEELKSVSIPYAIYYPYCLHQQKAYADAYAHVSLPNAESLTSHVFSIPFHPYMSAADQRYIAHAILAVLG